MNALLLLGSTYALVFLMGLQSQFVNKGRAFPAFFISIMIGGNNLILFKLAPDASGLEIAAYLTGGPLGIVSAIYFFRWLHRHKAHTDDRTHRVTTNRKDDTR